MGAPAPVLSSSGLPQPGKMLAFDDDVVVVVVLLLLARRQNYCGSSRGDDDGGDDGDSDRLHLACLVGAHRRAGPLQVR